MSNKVWTRNYDNLFSAFFGTTGGKAGSTASAPTYEYPCFRSSDGVYRTIIEPEYSGNCNFGALTIPTISTYMTTDSLSQFTSADVAIQLGSGTGIVSKDDYRLFLAEKTSFKITNQKRTWVYDDVEHKYTKCIEVAINYTGSSTKTITEFGLFGFPCCDRNNHGYSCLIYHEFLDTPITIEQNDTLSIKFYQSIVQPNYTPYPTTA